MVTARTCCGHGYFLFSFVAMYLAMGVRFACHVCNKRLNIKRELAGKRGVCPACSAKFRIPMEDTEHSTPVEAVRRQAVESPAMTDRSADNPAPREWIDEQADTSSPEEKTGEDTWYVRPPSGGQYGPASSEMLKQWVAEGRVAATALLWRDGWPQWRDASQVLPELAGQLPENMAPWAARSDSETGSRGQPGSQFGAAPKSELAFGGNAVVESKAEAGVPQRPKVKQRVRLIGVLGALSLLLVAVLLFVMFRG
jgi:hypothetical protein